MKSLVSALAAVATIGLQAATSYTATEQYVQNVVKAESNRTDIAIEALRQEVSSGYLTPTNILGGRNVGIAVTNGNVVISAVGGGDGTIDVDGEITQDSANPVSSAAIYAALQEKADIAVVSNIVNDVVAVEISNATNALPTMADIPTNNVQLVNGAGYVTGAGVTNIAEAAVGELSDKLEVAPISGTSAYMVGASQYAFYANAADMAIYAETAQNANSAFGLEDNVTNKGYRSAGDIFSQIDSKASTNDVVLTPVYSDTPTFSAWVLHGDTGGYDEISGPTDFGDGWAYSRGPSDSQKLDTEEEALYAQYLIFDDNVTATRTRTDIVGYTLGSQSDKPLQPKGDYASATNTYTKAETDAAIVRLAPAPGNYSTVSNAAMNALSRAEVEAGFTEWQCNPDAINGKKIKIVKEFSPAEETWMWVPYADDLPIGGQKEYHESDTSLVWDAWDGTQGPLTATRTRLPTMADLDGKASTNDVQLTPVYSQWTCNPPVLHGEVLSIEELADLYELRAADYPISSVVKTGGETSLTFSDRGVTASRTIVGYTLGTQSDKPLQPKGDYATTADLEGIDKLTIITQDTSLIFSTNEVGGAVFGGMRDADSGGEIVVDHEIIEGSSNAVAGGAVYTGLTAVRSEIASAAQSATNYTDEAIAPLCTTQAANDLFGNAISRTSGSMTSAGVVTDYLINPYLTGGVRMRYSSSNLENYTSYGYAGVTARRGGVGTDYTYDDTSTGFARLGDLVSISNLVNSKQDVLVAGSNISITKNEHGEAVISATGSAGGSSEGTDGTPEIVYKSNTLVNSTNTVVLTDNAYNNVTQGAESVLKIQMPASTGMRSRVFYLVYNCSNAGQTELLLDNDTLVTRILVKDGDQTVFNPSVGTNIYKFEEVASDTFLLSRTMAVEL